ncbi:hypothetical protein K1719_020782 [Acacia pycnantha]|nr:hypothetical protein K1719_020782 [Acacia pycnantha]
MTGLEPASSSLCYQWTYDVFINFRGEDTRHGFVGNLYNGLKNAGVHTFLDDEELRRGDEITPTLLKSIENSRMAIIVFSKNYASSTFCLNELVKIHECIKRKGRLVWPIFYDVEPSEVRHQTDHYERALSMHIKNLRADEDKIHSWKLALHEVSNISGHHFNPRQGYEYQFIEKIVKEVSSKINRVPLHVSEYSVGLESQVKEITPLLQMGSNDKVVMVGICGMGGLGKTTTARALYNSIADNFEGLCFLHDVKGKSRRLGLERIQEIILSKIVGVDIKIQDVNEGVQVIKKRFKEKKILLILDNVENHEQLKKLAGGCDWFSVGSRIIITTRDEQLLVAHGVESRYDMEVFNCEESLELLRWSAFRKPQVDPCYKDVLNRAITYAQGLPLALEVIGSNLCGKTINEWDFALDTYKLSLHKGIQQVLRVSYEDLEEVEKEIFLDIAFAFNGVELEYVKYMVEAVHDYDDLSYSIGVLVDKHLIKIESGNRIQMHDLIRDMGRKIVREESPNNPGERSRLWFHRDIVNVLERKTGTNKVRMIVQDNWRECIEVNWDGEAFQSMKELKILIFLNVKFSKDPKYLPESLKVLKWRRYPSLCLPPNFSRNKLVVLDMWDSYLSLLETIKTSDNLGILNLNGCEYVKEIPDLSNLRNLKELNLWNCMNLIEIHDSIGYLPKLEILIVAAWMKECHFLKTLMLNECKHLREVEGIPPSISCLQARNCVSLSVESKSIILSEELHGAPGRYNYNSEDEERCFFCVPSRSIPKWFDHRSKGDSVSFWFRNSFPPLCLCFLLKASDVKDFTVRVDINGERAFSYGLSNMSYISFTNPYYQTLDSTWSNQEQMGRMQEKEVAVNKKRGLMGDDNFASSSTAFICTKRARNSPINQDDNDASTSQVPFVKALEIINNNPGSTWGSWHIQL